MAVREEKAIYMTVGGPGAGQRDGWEAEVKLTVDNRGVITVKKPPGASGDTVRFTLVDLAAALERLKQR